MCGIAGILTFNEAAEPTAERINRMMERMIHRGPDDSGYEMMDGIALGFDRLSILGIDDGHQPMTNEDGSVWLVFNGEIYNYRALRSVLQSQGHVFRTDTDSEVIVHLYEQYGEHCVEHLRGMFAFAVWDRNERSVFAARDPFGIKPLYYYHDEDTFVFASEIKSILALENIRPAVEYGSLMHYLTFQYVPQPGTLFAGIRKLEPAHWMRVDGDGRMLKVRYWEPVFEPEELPFAVFMDELREKLQESVRLHLQSDVPIGSFLSGGIDSTAIAALIRKDVPVKTFSVGFEGPNDENRAARQMADILGTEHYEEMITPERFFADTLDAVRHMDEPVADPSAVALYALSRLASDHVTVVLSGEGADELFGGYRIYREPGSLKPLEWLPPQFRTAMGGIIRRIPFPFYGKNYLLRGFTSLEERFYGNAKIFDDPEKMALSAVHPEAIQSWEPASAITRTIYESSRHMDDVSRMQLIDLNWWLPGDILMKADKMSMAHSLELRVPFLDKEVFDVARRIPASYRIAGGTTKYVFREAMADIVPEHARTRPKLGFPVPLRHWLHGRWGDHMMEQIRDSGISDWIRLDAVQAMLTKHRGGQGNYTRKIWAIYIFALWHSMYIRQ